ncbi:Odorant receptor 16 [Cephus cinctus]|uniref:Odorant receptor n=1 Tax=Cephus cinctus TaxID=211228 RepID=A0A3L9LU54_CEPCN|nr:odorant receptor 24a isoform X2 [Cephus cinctus]RLZ02279.1 Odorant receptor 16 [Cephus cinctus]
MDISGAADILTWNKWVFSFLGIWPLDDSNKLFLFHYIYFMIHTCLEYVELFKYLNNLEYVVANLTENLVITLTFLKISAYRINKNELRKMSNDINDDFKEESYKDSEEKALFLEYNAIAQKFMKVGIPITLIAAVLYYLRPLTGHVIVDTSHLGNTSHSYIMPYRITLFFEITNFQMYVFMYAFEILNVPIIAFGFIGTDCLLITLVLHLCGQLAVLSHQVRNLTMNPQNFQNEFRVIVMKHLRLIRISKSLDTAFNQILIQQLVGMSLLLCLAGYNLIAMSDSGQNVHLITFIFYACSVSMLLFAYCLIGEYLINESTKIQDAFYNSTWYNRPPYQLELFLICMVFVQRPLVLTAGKIYSLSLSTFARVAKNSMAYLSVLRKFV